MTGYPLILTFGEAQSIGIQDVDLDVWKDLGAHEVEERCHLLSEGASDRWYALEQNARGWPVKLIMGRADQPAEARVEAEGNLAHRGRHFRILGLRRTDGSKFPPGLITEDRKAPQAVCVGGTRMCVGGTRTC